MGEIASFKGQDVSNPVANQFYPGCDVDEGLQAVDALIASLSLLSEGLKRNIEKLTVIAERLEKADGVTEGRSRQDP